MRTRMGDRGRRRKWDSEICLSQCDLRRGGKGKEEQKRKREWGKEEREREEEAVPEEARRGSAEGSAYLLGCIYLGFR
jgi:hypothetical protein